MAAKKETDELVCGSDAYPLYDPGTYDVRVVGFDKYVDPRFRQPKLKVQCHFLFAGIGDGSERENENDEVVGFFNLPRTGPITRGYKYYGVWSMANGGPPKRNDRMSPRILVGKFFRVEVGTVVHPYDGRRDVDPTKWRKHPLQLQYSTIKTWHECTGP